MTYPKNILNGLKHLDVNILFENISLSLFPFVLLFSLSFKTTFYVNIVLDL